MAGEERVLVPPREGEGDVVVVARVVVDAGVAGGGAGVEEEEGRVAVRGRVAVGEVVRERDGEGCYRGGWGREAEVGGVGVVIFGVGGVDVWGG